MTWFLVFYVPGALLYAAFAIGTFAGTETGTAVHRSAARAIVLTPVWPMVAAFYLSRWGSRIWREADLQDLFATRSK